MYSVVYFNWFINASDYNSDVIILPTKYKNNHKEIENALLKKFEDLNKEVIFRISVISTIDFDSYESAEEHMKKYPVKTNKHSFFFQWHFTRKCNQNCVQCYLDSSYFHLEKNSEMTEEQCKYVVDKAYEFCNSINATPMFALTGGHPLLSEKFNIILEHIDSYRKKGNLSSIFILGNPQFVLDNIETLEKYNIDSYQISIDGFKNTHDEWRIKGSFDSSIESLLYLKNHTNIVPRVMATLSKSNADDIIKLFEFICHLDLPYFAYSRLVPNCSDKSSNYFEEHFSPEEYYSFMEKMYSKIIEMKEKGFRTKFVFKDHLWKPFMLENGYWNMENMYGEIERETIYDGCHINQDSLCITPNGDVLACMKVDSKMGNMFNDSLEDIYCSDIAENFRDFSKYEKCSTCKYKNFCRGCHGVSYGVYKDFFKPDPQCWL